MQPGDTVSRPIVVRDSAGAPVLGLALGDFTTSAHARTVGAGTWSAYSAGLMLAEIGGGKYAVTFTLPASPGEVDIRIRPLIATRISYPVGWQGEIEVNDRDSLFAGLNVVRATLSDTFQLGAQMPATLVRNRYRLMQVTVTDGAGGAVDGSGYGNLIFGVRSGDHVTTTYDQSVGITFGAGGLLSIEIPEDASFFAALPDGADTANLRYEVIGDIGGDAAKTVPLIRSSALTLVRDEALV